MATKSKDNKYFEAVGRRKTSVARVRIFNSTAADSGIFINEKSLQDTKYRIFLFIPGDTFNSDPGWVSCCHYYPERPARD